MNIIPFNFESKEVRVVEINNEPWFVATDVCAALGFSNARQAVNSHVDQEDVQKLDTPTNGGIQKINYVNESGLYALIFGSTLDSAREFKRFVTSEILPSIRKHGSYSIQKQTSEPEKLQCDLMFLEYSTRVLRVSESGKLGMLRKVQAHHNILDLLPSYAIDAPSDSVDGSSRVTGSLTSLLKKHGISISTAEFNKLLQAKGLIEQRERASTKTPDKIKKFWSVTHAGLLYGKNVTSDANQRETAPHWFESRFSQLLLLIGIKSQEAA